jgi:hypothetical protein
MTEGRGREVGDEKLREGQKRKGRERMESRKRVGYGGAVCESLSSSASKARELRELNHCLAVSIKPDERESRPRTAIITSDLEGHALLSPQLSPSFPFHIFPSNNSYGDAVCVWR